MKKRQSHGGVAPAGPTVGHDEGCPLGLEREGLECTPKLRHSDVEQFRSERRTANERVASVCARVQEEGGRALKGMYERGGACPRAKGIAWNPVFMAGQSRGP